MELSCKTMRRCSKNVSESNHRLSIRKLKTNYFGFSFAIEPPESVWFIKLAISTSGGCKTFAVVNSFLRVGSCREYLWKLRLSAGPGWIPNQSKIKTSYQSVLVWLFAPSSWNRNKKHHQGFTLWLKHSVNLKELLVTCRQRKTSTVC